MLFPQILKDRCTGCGRCVAACQQKLFTLETAGFRKNAALRHPERCTSCGKCAAECPPGAIAMRKKHPAALK